MKKIIFIILLSCMFISTVDAADYLCKRATTLHTEMCNNEDGCIDEAYSKGDAIIYGNKGTGSVLNAGDAFDCDVNGDGLYDSETERFYYVSDYYDTKLDSYNSSYATLIYYKNITNEKIAYNDGTYADMWDLDYGDLSITMFDAPFTAVAYLSKYVNKTTWPNVSLYEKNRTIIIDHYLSYQASYGNFPYSKLTNARFLTYTEIIKNCIMYTETEFYIPYLNNKCSFLWENTSEADYWLETPNQAGEYAKTISNDGLTSKKIVDADAGVRPVIDVAKSDMEGVTSVENEDILRWTQFIEKYTNEVNKIDEYNYKINSTLANLTVKTNDDNTNFITEFKHDNGILTYDTKYLKEGSTEDEVNRLLILAAVQTLAELKGYDKENFINWMNSVDDETLSNYTLEKDGIKFVTNTINVEENGSTIVMYQRIFELDLENGIKAYDPSINYPDADGSINNPETPDTDNNTEEPETPTEDKEVDEYPNLPENPQTGAFVSIVAVLGAIGIIAGIVYYIKKKNMFHKI